MKIICILFHVGKKKSEITQDSRWRLLAGAELAKKNEKALVLFVGGGGLEIFGAELLKEFWVKNFPEIKNEYFVLNSSNNTFDNLKEVQSFLVKKSISFPEVNIISSLYHQERLQKIASKLNSKATILSAEEILISKNKQIDEVKKYLNSAEYRKKIFLEWILRACLFLDSKQRMIRAWRWFSYNR
ncbi:MAG: ElyC/SanA/YdcF family protein [Parcubacteria group bacterium]|jgi:hypothetical protein